MDVRSAWCARHSASSYSSIRRTAARAALGTALAAFSSLARAAFLSGEALDTAADIVAIVVLIVVPIVVIVVFWLVHVLPERFAEKRHHPQAAAIQTLCLLSLFFGGLLWPLAWLWAFTKPVGYRMAYGTDKHETYHEEMGEKARAGALLQRELDHLREELDAMAAKGALTPGMQRLREDLAAVAVRDAAEAAAPAAAPGGRA
jgi:CBS domain containing-hemolysin-like protein